INGKHIEEVELSENNYIKASGVTHEKRHLVSCLKELVPLFKDSKVSIMRNDEGIFYQVEIEAMKDIVYTFEQYAVIGVNQSDDILSHILKDVKSAGYQNRLDQHNLIWNQKWNDSNVIIQGDDEADL